MTVRRRSDTPLTTQSLLDQILHHALDWPGSTVRFERDSVQDYVQRPVSGRVSLGELCHENGKLSSPRLRELAVSRLEPATLRNDYVRRRAAVPKPSAATVEVDWRVRALLGALATMTQPELYYAVELRVVLDNLVAVHEPVTATLQILKFLTLGERERLTEALQLLASGAGSGPLVCVVGSFARNEVLYGHRGHRRTMMEAGQVVQALVETGLRVGQQVGALYEFVDREVDALLEADGIEESTLAVVEFRERRQ